MGMALLNLIELYWFWRRISNIVNVFSLLSPVGKDFSNHKNEVIERCICTVYAEFLNKCTGLHRLSSRYKYRPLCRIVLPKGQAVWISCDKGLRIF